MDRFFKFEYTKFGLWCSDDVYQIYDGKKLIFSCLYEECRNTNYDSLLNNDTHTPSHEHQPARWSGW